MANLFLSRGVSRERELALRAALGAGRLQLVRQALAEALLLSVTGGILGVGLAWGLIRAFPGVAPRGFPRLDEVGLDERVLAVTLMVATGSGMLAALAPAWRASRARASALHEGDRRSTGAAARRLRLGPEEVTLLDHHRYYRDRNDLRLEERAALNYDHPDALETDLTARAGRLRARPDDGVGHRLVPEHGEADAVVGARTAAESST